MAEVIPHEMMRILREIRRTLAGYQALFDAQREEIAQLRAELQSMRADMKHGFIQQHAILAHNSILIDEQADRLTALEENK